MALMTTLALAGCQAPGPQGRADAQEEISPQYQGSDVLSLGDDLVNVHATMTGARDESAVTAYADCIVAAHALSRGYGFARHIRTNVAFEGGIWIADAVYTISPALPRGLRTIDAEVAVQNCVADGIPTI